MVTIVFPQHPVTVMVTELDDDVVDPEPSGPQACIGDIVILMKECSSPTLLASAVGRTGDLQSSPPDPLLLTDPDDDISASAGSVLGILSPLSINPQPRSHIIAN